MGIEVLMPIIAGLLALLGSGIASSALIQRMVRRLFGIRQEPGKPYSERLSELTTGLTKASREVDSLLTELAEVACDRESAVQKLETDL